MDDLLNVYLLDAEDDIVRAAAVAELGATQVDRDGNVLVLQHENVETAPYQNVSSVTVLTRGLHPGEPASYQSLLVHTANSELTSFLPPGGPQLVTIYCCDECGCPCQQLVKDLAVPSGLRDVVWDYKHDDDLALLRRITDPRGNDPAIVGGSIVLESVALQTPRAWIGASSVLRDAFTTFVDYDPMDVGAVAEADRTLFGPGVAPWFDGPGVYMPKGYGHDTDAPPGHLHLPASFVFDADSDGKPDRGGNPVATGGPRPQGNRPRHLHAHGLGHGPGDRALPVVRPVRAAHVRGRAGLRLEPDRALRDRPHGRPPTAGRAGHERARRRASRPRAS